MPADAAAGASCVAEDMERIMKMKAELAGYRKLATGEQTVLAREYVMQLNTTSAELLKEGRELDTAARLLNEAEYLTREEEEYFGTGTYPRKVREEQRAATFSSLAFLARITQSEEDAVLFLLEAATLEGDPTPATNVSLALLLLELGRHDAAAGPAQQAVDAMAMKERTSALRGGLITTGDLSLLASAYHLLSVAQSGSVLPERRAESSATLRMAHLYASELDPDNEVRKQVDDSLAAAAAAPSSSPSSPELLPSLPPARIFHRRNLVPLPSHPSPPPPQQQMNRTYPPPGPHFSGTGASYARDLSSTAVVLPPAPPRGVGGGEAPRRRRHGPFAHLVLEKLEKGEDAGDGVVAVLENTRNGAESYPIRVGVTTLGSAQLLHACSGESRNFVVWKDFASLRPVHCLLACDRDGSLYAAAAGTSCAVRKNGFRIGTAAEPLQVGDRLTLGTTGSDVVCTVKPPLVQEEAAPGSVQEGVGAEEEANARNPSAGDPQFKVIKDDYQVEKEWTSLGAGNIKEYVEYLKEEVAREERLLSACPHPPPNPPSAKKHARVQVAPTTPPSEKKTARPNLYGLHLAEDLLDGESWLGLLLQADLSLRREYPSSLLAVLEVGEEEGCPSRWLSSLLEAQVPPPAPPPLPSPPPSPERSPRKATFVTATTTMLDLLIDTFDPSQFPALSLLYELSPLQEPPRPVHTLPDSAAAAGRIQRGWRGHAARKVLRARRRQKDGDSVTAQRDEAAAFIQWHHKRLRHARYCRTELALRKTLLQNHLHFRELHEKAASQEAS